MLECYKFPDFLQRFSNIRRLFVSSKLLLVIVETLEIFSMNLEYYIFLSSELSYSVVLCAVSVPGCGLWDGAERETGRSHNHPGGSQ